MAGLKKKNNYVYVRDEETGTISRIDTKKNTHDAALAKAGVDSGKKKTVDESEFSNPSEETLKIRNVYAEKLKADKTNQQPKQSFIEKQASRFTEPKEPQQASVVVPKTENRNENPKTEIPFSQPETTNDYGITSDDMAEVSVEFGVNPNDDEQTALGKFTDKMVSSGMFTFDKNGKLVPTKAPYKPGWETFANLGSILLTAVGAMMGVPIPPINFSKLTGATGRREAQEAEWQKMQNDMAETYNQLQDIYAKAGVEQSTAEKAGYTNAAVQGGKAMSDWSTESALQMAKVNLQNNEEMARLSNKLQKDLYKELAKYDVNKQIELMDKTSEWMLQHPGKAAAMNAKDIINIVGGLL